MFLLPYCGHKISIREILDPLIVGFNLSQSMNFCGLGLGSFSKSGSRILRGLVARIWLTMRVNYVYVHIGIPTRGRQECHFSRGYWQKCQTETPGDLESDPSA